MTRELRRVELFGTPIDNLSMTEVLDLCEEAIARRERLLIGVVNAAKLVNMSKSRDLARAVHSADICLADGMSVVWAMRLLGEALPERVAGIDLMTELLARADRQHFRVYLLGARHEVLSRAIERIQADYPGAEIVGYQHGYFEEEEEEEIARRVARARPDIIFVGMTSPRKERFLARWRPLMNVPVCHGVGGAIDVLAGEVVRAPLIWQKLGLEWLYRVKQEPRRLWRRYLVTNCTFLWWLAEAAGARWLLGHRLRAENIRPRLHGARHAPL